MHRLQVLLLVLVTGCSSGQSCVVTTLSGTQLEIPRADGRYELSDNDGSVEILVTGCGEAACRARILETVGTENGLRSAQSESSCQ